MLRANSVLRRSSACVSWPKNAFGSMTVCAAGRLVLLAEHQAGVVPQHRVGARSRSSTLAVITIA